MCGAQNIAILFSPRGSIRMRSPSYFVRISLRSLKIVGLFFVSCRKRALSAFMWCILANVQRRDRGNITSISNSKEGCLQFSQFCSLVSDSLHYARLPHIVFTLVYENVHKGCLAPKEIWIFYSSLESEKSLESIPVSESGSSTTTIEYSTPAQNTGFRNMFQSEISRVLKARKKLLSILSEYFRHESNALNDQSLSYKIPKSPRKQTFPRGE